MDMHTKMNELLVTSLVVAEQEAAKNSKQLRVKFHMVMPQLVTYDPDPWEPLNAVEALPILIVKSPE